MDYFDMAGNALINDLKEFTYQVCQGPLYSPPQVQFIPHLKKVNSV